MAFPSNHTLLTLRGKQFTTQEDWAFGIRFSGAGTPTQAMADAAAAHAKTWITTANTGYSAQTLLTAVKLAQIGTNGLYIPGSVAIESFPTSAYGSYGSAVVHPPQIALAMTLQSVIPRGPGHQTHVFLPGPHFPVESSSSATISASNITNILANFRTMLLGFNGDGFGTAGVWSKAHAIAGTVTMLRCGRVFDTMRSRRTSIPEDYRFLAM
jgi:hypothetical protein